MQYNACMRRVCSRSVRDAAWQAHDCHWSACAAQLTTRGWYPSALRADVHMQRGSVRSLRNCAAQIPLHGPRSPHQPTADISRATLLMCAKLRRLACGTNAVRAMECRCMQGALARPERWRVHGLAVRRDLGNQELGQRLPVPRLSLVVLLRLVLKHLHAATAELSAARHTDT